MFARLARSASKSFTQEIPLVWLFSVQFVEMLWVMLNHRGIECACTDALVSTVSNIHWEYLP